MMSIEPKLKHIEVGAADDTFELWAAKAAVEQGDLILNAQADGLLAAETRASSLLGWISAGSLAALAVFAQDTVRREGLAIASLGAPAALVIALCIVALWPQRWNWAGTDPIWMLTIQGPDDCELNTLQAMAAGRAKAIRENNSRLAKFGKLMTAAWIAFSLIPLAAAALVIFSVG